MYTIMMLDPDAPNSGAGQFYVHWIVTNIPVRKEEIYVL